MTLEVIILALTASAFTAMASVAQRRAAAPAPEKIGFSWRLVGYLLHRPVWFLGILSMIIGFLFQVEALRRGSLALVQPLIATELVIVFGIIALHDRHRVHARDWFAALGMVLGLGIFLALARPSGGHSHASAVMWGVSGLSTFVLAGILAGLAYLPGRHGSPPHPGRKASLLGIAAATEFGFVAAVIKELSTHLSQGPYGIFTNWSPYVLILSGATAMFLASNAFQAGSLAASQPGLTIVDPLVASVLGVVLFRETVNHGALDFAGEVAGVLLLVASVIVLSRSPLVQDAEESAKEAVEEDRPELVAAAVAAESVSAGSTASDRFGRWVPRPSLPFAVGGSTARSTTRPGTSSRAATSSRPGTTLRPTTTSRSIPCSASGSTREQEACRNTSLTGLYAAGHDESPQSLD